MSTNHVVILGSGLAGYSLVKELRQLNQQIPITLITADRGDYYSKPQLSTAYDLKRSAADLVMNTKEQMAEKFNINIVTQTLIQSIDRHAKKVIADQYECDYNTLVLALGADTLSVPLNGDGVDDVHTVNTLEQYDQFRQSLDGKKYIGILGSGLVGCEFANDLMRGGYHVEVIAPDRYPLQRFVPEQIGFVLQDALSAQGVVWHPCRFATEVNHSKNGYDILLDNMQKITVEAVLSAIGLHPRTQLAQSADLAVERGIVTNALLQTSDPSIYALGDCAEVGGHVLQHIAPLLVCARALAKTLNGEPTSVRYPAMPIMVKTPICPITVCPVPHSVEGVWHVTGEAPNLEAHFINSHGNLSAFALSGTLVQRRAELLKRLPDVFE